MSTETISQFIEKTLHELSEDYQVPSQIIPHIVHLIENYPNPEVPRAKTELRDALAKIIEDLRKQGELQ